MPIKRRRQKSTRVTPAAVEAFLAGDREGLGRAIQQRPWQPTPFLCCGEHGTLGVCPLDPAPGDGTAWSASVPEVIALREDILAAAGGLEPGLPETCRCAAADRDFLATEQEA